LKICVYFVQNYGENLYQSSDMKLTGTEVVQKWYDEINDYPASYGEVPFGEKTGETAWCMCVLVTCGF
jgi:hypothetical protein